MFIGPSLNICPECKVKSAFAQNLFTQNSQTQCRFVIGRPALINSLDHIQCHHDRIGIAVQFLFNELMLILKPVIFAFVEIICAERIYKSVQSFIHPRKFAFIGSYDHGKPGVAKFMICHSPQTRTPRSVTAENDPRIFHSTHGTGSIGSDRIRIFKPFI